MLSMMTWAQGTGSEDKKINDNDMMMLMKKTPCALMYEGFHVLAILSRRASLLILSAVTETGKTP